MAKCRTAPSTFTTVPRLELQACTVAARMNQFLHRELDLVISRTVFWTDSRICLQYIVNETRKFQTYVAHRVTEIRDCSEPSQWRFCPGKLNPADDTSRGLSAEKYLKNERFLHGPEFLRSNEDEWPQIAVSPLPASDAEIREEVILLASTRLTPAPKTLMDIVASSSDLGRLQRRFALLTKFREFMNTKVPQDLALTPDDYEQALITMIRLVQAEHFSEEINRLRDNKYVSRNSVIRKFDPWIHTDGTLRVGGRLRNSTLPHDTRFPFILPKNQPLTTAVVLFYHQKSCHAGPEHVNADVRERFMIVHSKSVIKGIIGKCFKCRKYLARTIEQKMSDLPQVRFETYTPPFQGAVGIDFFGPMYVSKGKRTRRKGAQAKRYGCIFTCLTTRAAHLELIDSMDASSFLNAFRRFVSRRGPCKTVLSDNGTNLVGGEREMREAVQEWNKVASDKYAQHGITWKWIPPYASSMAGIWESQVKAAKRALKMTLDTTLTTDEVLRTVLTEVESMMNSRPLTPVSDDPNDNECLTPNHFLLRRQFSNLPPGVFVEADLYRKKWRQVQYISDIIWKRFRAEYLTGLQKRSKWLRAKHPPVVGDVVHIVEPNLPRGLWKVGIVTKLGTSSHDGHIRSVEVKIGENIYLRPLTKLCLLEGPPKIENR